MIKVLKILSYGFISSIIVSVAMIAIIITAVSYMFLLIPFIIIKIRDLVL